MIQRLYGTMGGTRKNPVIGGIVRVSTKHQGLGQSPENQREVLRQAGVTRFFEAVESGFKEKRRESLQPLFEAIEKREITKLLVTDLSRAARRDTVLTELTEACDKYGVEFLAGGMTMSHQNAYIWYSTKQLSLNAELYSRDLSDRIRRGQKSCRDRGKFGFTSKHIPWHLQKDPNDPYKIVKREEVWDDARQAAMDKALGKKTSAQICRDLYAKHGVMGSASSLTKWLGSYWIRGHYGSRDNDDVHIANVAPALLTEGEYALLEQRLKANRKRAGSRAPHTIKALSGLCKCSSCEKRMTQNITRGIVYFRCNNPQCKNGTKAMRMDAIENTVRENIGLQVNYAAEVIRKRTVKTKPTKQLLKLQTRLKKLEEALAIMDSPGVRADYEDARRQIAELQDDMKPEPAPMFTLGEVVDIGSVGWWNRQGEPTRNTIYRMLFEAIWVDTAAKQVTALDWKKVPETELSFDGVVPEGLTA